MSMIAPALVLGMIAGLRTLTAPAVLAWAAYGAWLPVAGTWAEFLAFAYTPWILSALALGELITDKLPQTPSRKVPIQFGARLVSGAFCGAILGELAGNALLGGVAGLVGAVAGTLGGAGARTRLADVLGNDRPAALIEDAVAIAGASLVLIAFAMVLP